MPSPEQLTAWDQAHYWHSFTQMAEYEPLVIERAAGCLLVDIHGREFIDGASSMWCNVHGHSHPRINRAIGDQLEKIAHCTSLGMANSTTVELAKRLVEIVPPGLERVFFSSDGASAVEAAVKIAFQYWRQCEEPQPNKTRFVALGAAYHGDTIGSVSLGGVDRFTSMFAPLLFEVLRVPAPDGAKMHASVPPDRACDHYLGFVEELLAKQHEQIAALVVEPLVQGAAGILVHPPGYLRGLRELTRKYRVLLVADEVAVGFGRTGTMFACEQEKVTPDLLCLGKGLTGGYLPMAATLATDEVYSAFLGPADSFRAFLHGHTFAGNPLAAAAAIATLDLFKEERTLENVAARSVQLETALDRISHHPHVGHIRHKGLMVGIDLIQDKERNLPYPAPERRGAAACHNCMDRGVWLRPLGDTIVIVPPLSISSELLTHVLHAVEYGIDRATR
jgi:adenosylmethionine-8-amino-7-oxononanoate aminotransferase